MMDLTAIWESNPEAKEAYVFPDGNVFVNIKEAMSYKKDCKAQYQTVMKARPAPQEAEQSTAEEQSPVMDKKTTRKKQPQLKQITH